MTRRSCPLAIALLGAGCLARHELRPLLQSREVGEEFVHESADERDRHPNRYFYDVGAAAFGPLPRVFLEPRARAEQNDNIDIGDSSAIDDQSTLTRVRLVIDSGWWHEFLNYRIELQDARKFVLEEVVEEDTDARQAYVLLKTGKRAIWGLKLGRQEIDLGSGVFLGADWHDNYDRSFDGARLTLSDRWSRFEPRQWSWRLDLFAAGPVTFGPDGGREPMSATGIHYSDRRAYPFRIDGLFLLTVSDETDFEGELGGAGREVFTTFAGGVEATRFGRADGVSLELNGALQLGDVGPDDHFAVAATAECSYIFPTPWEVRVRATLAYASGDSDPDDGRSGTFRPQFTGDLREKLGLLGLVGLRNCSAAGSGLSFGPVEGFRVGADARLLWVADEEAGWFDASGEQRDETYSLAGTFLGRELDVFARYRFMTSTGKGVWLEGGYAIFEPGGNHPPGTEPAQRTYVQIASRF